MNNDGWWIKDFTSTLKWGWFTDVPTAHFWEYVRLRANKEDIEWQGKVIPRGSFVSSVGHMSIECGLSPKQIRLAISKLEKTGEITTIRANKYTQINVVKYPDYQSTNIKEGKQKGKQEDKQRETQKDTERATIQDIKSIRDIDNKEINKESFDCSPELADALREFEQYRKMIKKPLTDKAKKRTLDDLNKLAPDEETKIKIIHQSIDRGWVGVFPLGTQTKQKGMVNILDL